MKKRTRWWRSMPAVWAMLFSLLDIEPLAKLVMRGNVIAGLGMMEGRGRPFLA